MSPLFWAFFVLCSALSYAAYIKPRNTLTEYGAVTRLTCCFNRSDATGLEWKFLKWNEDGGLFAKICSTDKCRDGYWTDNSQQFCSHLVINFTTFDVAGLYQCIQSGASLGYGSHLVVYNLTCGANISFDDELVEGDSMSFFCKIIWKGKFPFKLKWTTEEGSIILSEDFGELRENYNSSLSLKLQRPILPSYVASLLFLNSGITDENIDRYCPSVNWTSPSRLVMFPAHNIRISCPQDGCHRSIGSLVNCSADGQPRPEFKWTDWDGKIASNSSVLTVISQDSHEYVCSAINTIRGVKYEVSQRVSVKGVTGETATKSPSPEDGSKLSYGAIIGIGVAIFIALLLIFAVLVVIAVNLDKHNRLTRTLVEFLGFSIAPNKREFLKNRSFSHEGKKSTEEEPLKSKSKEPKDTEDVMELHQVEDDEKAPVQASS